MDIYHSDYVLLSTRKRNGDWVDTPVWCAPAGDRLYLFSAGDAGKVKRLRNFSEVKLAPCNVVGKVLGASVDGCGELLSDAAAQQAHRALLDRYGWQMRGLDLLSRLSGKFHRRQYIAITLK